MHTTVIRAPRIFRPCYCPVMLSYPDTAELSAQLDIIVQNKFLYRYTFCFQTRQTQMNSLKKQMNEMQTTLQGMSKLKHRLHEQSDDFRRDLVLLLVGRSTVRENDFTHVIDQVRTLNSI